jgi:two-component system response regulator DesR
MTAKIRILLAEDQAMVRGALTALLNLEEDLEVVAEVSQGDQVLPTAKKTKPDVALLDIEMPGSDGLTVSIAQDLPSCRIVTSPPWTGISAPAMESGGFAKMRRQINWQ